MLPLFVYNFVLNSKFQMFLLIAEAVALRQSIPLLNMISRVRIQQMATWDKVKMVEIKKIMFIYNCLIFKSLIDTSTIVK
jgi:hypothetical protein